MVLDCDEVLVVFVSINPDTSMLSPDVLVYIEPEAYELFVLD